MAGHVIPATDAKNVLPSYPLRSVSTGRLARGDGAVAAVAGAALRADGLEDAEDSVDIVAATEFAVSMSIRADM